VSVYEARRPQVSTRGPAVAKDGGGGAVRGVGLASCNRQVAVRVPAAQLHVTTLGKLFTHICASVHQAVKIGTGQRAGKVIV